VGLHADAEGLVVAVDGGPVGGFAPSRGLRHQIPPVNSAAAVANVMRPVGRLRVPGSAQDTSAAVGVGRGLPSAGNAGA
jgi:hypothetical protein